MTLTTEQVIDAVRQMHSHCDLLMAKYEAGIGEYKTVSARGVLYELGFGDNVDQILDAIASAGFNYCLDYSIRCPSGEYPAREVCYWGADQLESRLAFIDHRIEFAARNA